MYIVNQKNFETYEKAKYYAVKNKFSFVYNTETQKTTDIRKKVYIIYLYNQKNNDIQYVKEFTESKNILQFLNIIYVSLEILLCIFGNLYIYIKFRM